MDWMDTPPYTDDFLRPADSTSVVYEFWVANGYRHRVVFPAGSTVMGGMTYNKEMTFFGLLLLLMMLLLFIVKSLMALLVLIMFSF